MTLQERFEAKFLGDPNSGCWLWDASIQPPPSLPYGRFQLSKRKGAYAHRVAYELYIGPIPQGLSVLHKCDTPPCVNPSHLFLGTYADNNRDKETKGRANHAHGVGHGMVKLSHQEVVNIKKLLAIGFSLRSLAKRFKVHRCTILDIKMGRTWKHLILTAQ